MIVFRDPKTLKILIQFKFDYKKYQNFFIY